MIFKKTVIFLILLSLIFACGEGGSDKNEISQYQISGDIIGAKSHEISLMKYEKGELINIETSKIINNKFNFLAGNVEAPEYYYLKIGKDEVRSCFQKSFKPTNEVIAQKMFWFNKLNQIEKVYVLGHSLSKVDMPYFQEIVKHLKGEQQWFVSYHNTISILSNLSFNPVTVSNK